jgi:hypothetical protein
MSARTRYDLLWLAACSVLLAILIGCASFTAADEKALGDTTKSILVCQTAGLTCKDDQKNWPDAAADGGRDCWIVYDNCMVDAGMRQ